MLCSLALLTVIITLTRAYRGSAEGLEVTKFTFTGAAPKQIPLQHAASKSISVNAPPLVPQSAFGYIDPTFAAFACEERSFIFYAGPSDKPNQFSRNLIHEISKRTGIEPVIRVGGTSLYAVRTI